MSRRVLHIVRDSLPDPRVVQPGDLVVYIRESAPASGPRAAHERIWHALWHAPAPDEHHDPRPERSEPRQSTALDSRAVCELAFEYDSVIVW